MFKRNIQKRSQANGFTIVELLIVIVVIGILATITIVSYASMQDRAHRRAIASNIESYARALDMYFLDHGTYPLPNDFANRHNTVCIGKPAPGDDDICSKLTTQGCGSLGFADGQIVGETSYDDSLSSLMEDYVGTEMQTVLTKPMSITTSLGDCSLVTEMHAASYQAFQKAWRDPNTGAGSSIVASKGSGPAMVYEIIYPAVDGDCGIEDSIYYGDVCTVIGGDPNYIEYE